MEEEGSGAEAWEVIASFPSVMDLVFVEAEFREREVPYRLRDTLSVQVAPHMAGALGGIRLEVPSIFRERATDILLDLGVHQLAAAEENPLLASLDRATRRGPFARWSLPARLMLFVLLVALVGGSLGWALYRQWGPTPWERLTAEQWCIRSAYLDGEAMQLSSTSLHLVIAGCEETIHFRDDLSVTLPGLGTSEVQARWMPEGDDIRISDADTLAEVYEGLYAFRVVNRMIELRSRRVHIIAEELVWGINLPLP